MFIELQPTHKESAQSLKLKKKIRLGSGRDGGTQNDQLGKGIPEMTS